jgi:energy-coupling factor transport system permease protein
MLVYRNRDTFLQQLHPFTGLLFVIIYTAGVLIIENPLYVLLIIFSVIALSLIDGSFVEINGYLRMILPITFLIVLFNTLFNHNGNTVIFAINHIPIIGSLRITLEALLYGIAQSIRLIGITLIFGFGNLILHPDRTFSFFSKYIGNSALLMNLTLKLFPTILKSLNNIIEIEKLRGNKLFEKSLKKSIKNQSNILNILFQSCLEDAGDMAESMYSRGYGLGKRSVYFFEKFSIFDKLFNLIFILIFLAFSFLQYYGLNEMEFYPIFTNPFTNINTIGVGFCSLFYVPVIINWGWKSWK